MDFAENGDNGKSIKGNQIFSRVEYVLGVINQMCIGFITIFITWLCIREQMRFMHAFLSTIGFILLMAEGAMCHYGNNVLTFTYSHKTKTTIHWVLQLLGGGCGVAGSIIEFDRIKFPSNSLHSDIGLAAFILCLISMLSGLFALFAGTLRKCVPPLHNKTFHAFIGFATIVLGFVAQVYAYQCHLITLYEPTSMGTLLQVLTLIALVLTSIGPLKSLYNRLVGSTVNVVVTCRCD